VSAVRSTIGFQSPAAWLALTPSASSRTSTE
jgi:hypothetical protein